MHKILWVFLALVCSSQLLADCKEFALQGEWNVFYRDNAFPSSVLAADKIIDIRYLSDLDQFSVALNDDNWQAWSSGWTHECINGQTVLIGAIEKRKGGMLLVVEISRVTEVSDLLARASGEVKLNQINIQFPDQNAYNDTSGIFDVAKKTGYLASHPGHAHADN